MKTANKIIDDRISILGNFIETKKDSLGPSEQENRKKAELVQSSFVHLKSAIEEHNNLMNAGIKNEELCEKIKELLGQTMVPLIERNKQSLDHYKQKIFSFYQKSEEIKKTPDLENNLPLREELNTINASTIEYDKAKKDLIDYLEEYETALSEIKQLLDAEPGLNVSDDVAQSAKPDNIPASDVNIDADADVDVDFSPYAKGKNENTGTETE